MEKHDFGSPGDLFFQSIFEHFSDPAVVLDADEGVLLMNRAAREFRGVDLQALFAVGRDNDLASFLGKLRLGEPATIELQVKGADGAVRHFALEGRREGAYRVVFVREVTERRQLDEELQHLRRVESFGYLTASVAHDFNNLLTVIGCTTAVLASEARAHETGAGEHVLALANEIQSATERATTMVRQLLSRMRRKSSRPEAVNVGEVVVELRPLLERLVGDDVEVSLLLDPELGATVVDRSALEHALLNLAANARDAMPQGGRFTVATCNVSLGEDGVVLGEDLPPNGRYVALTVSDSGVGMSREVRERIFERFFTTKSAAHGSGLGLAMVRRFAVQSGGCVAAHSTPGQGTTIVLYLPRAPRAGAQRSLTSCPLS
jgi:two-component system, cell cycle sensor histidine kinase and response regulator CckA